MPKRGSYLDETAKAARKTCISRVHSKVSVWVIPTNEELTIARHTGSLLGLMKSEQAINTSRAYLCLQRMRISQ
jgi:hypothetical protein